MVISSFLSQGDELGSDPMAVSAPQANAYEFQSSGIVDMLEKLKDKFEDERTDLEKEESNARLAYEMLIQDLTAQIETATEDREAKAQEKASKLQKAAEDKGELAAIDKAIEILSSGSVSGTADKYLPSFVQKKSSVSFLQLSVGSKNPSQARVAEFLREKGSAINSRVLSALAVRVAEDPFVKVKKMIKDLIVRLMEEANEEAEHKGWCDTELSTNEQTRKEKTAAVETLHAEIDELSASIAKLTQEITDLTAEIAEIDKAVAEATAIREEEKATNEQTVKDATEAQTAVAQALTVLKEFYEKAAEATALLQGKQKPEIFDEPYTGMQSENGGVVGMIEVIQSDFARLEADTTAADEEEQKEYDVFMTESATDKAQKLADIDHKSSTKQNDEQSLEEAKTDLEATQKELDAAMEVYEKLKPSCVDAGVSYEDRVARRKEEIESLQEALKILTGEEIA